VPVIHLSDCCESIADGDHQAPPKADSGIPFITISNVSASNRIDFENTKFVPKAYYDALADKRKAHKDDILYTVVGSFGIPIFIEDDTKFAFQRHIAILRPDKEVVISKYLYHFFQSTNFLKQAHAVAAGAAQKTITLASLDRMKVSVPSLAEQARIVAILDKFDALTHSLTEGLPREIELRQKQYEHYRDLLLSFPKPQEVVA
jgi:type I restriction enzyme S subunit